MSLLQCSNCLRTYTSEEFMRLESQWADKSNREYGKEGVCLCGKKFFQDKWQKRTNHPSGYIVSTVHLEAAYPSDQITSSEKIMWYQTMIMDKKGGFFLFLSRYHYMKSAIDGHRKTLGLLPKIIENPEKYPTDTVSAFLNTLEK